MTLANWPQSSSTKSLGAFARGGSTQVDINTQALVNPTQDQAASALQDLMPRFGASASQRPNPAPVPQPKPVDTVPQGDVPYGGYKKGGKAQGMDGGGIPTSEALSPWYARAEERSMVQPEGLINSTGAGRTDVHNISVPSGAYILPADVVSGLGENNTLAGAAVIDRMMHSNPYGIQGSSIRHGSGPPRAPAPFKQTNYDSRGGTEKAKPGTQTVPICVAGGEVILYPETIMKKFGSLDRGHKTLDKFVLNTRRDNIKKMQKLKPPKK